MERFDALHYAERATLSIVWTKPSRLTRIYTFTDFLYIRNRLEDLP